MIHPVRVLVRLRPKIHDPQGEAIRRALGVAGVAGIESVRQGKVFDLEVEAPTPAEAEAKARDLAGRVLANPVLEDFAVEVRSR